jgi:autotransporter-associated beta strand protein
VRPFFILFALSLASHAQLTWSLASGNGSWPADKRAAIIAAMDEAVALYNAHGYFPKTLWANYSPSVPTAQASYSGWIDFGGSIGTRVALHEISHTLGVGQVTAWNANRSGNTWTGTFAINRVKLFNGPAATLSADAAHFWPYGLNYDTEDGSTTRVRHIKMVSAMRRDMGIVTDSDNDGIPNDWEMFYFGNLSQTATGDADGDGVNNLSEYNADTHPAAATFQWTGASSTAWTETSNWSSVAGPRNGTFFARINVNNASNNPLVYDASLGSTILIPSDRGLVIGSGGLGGGSLSITGGSLSTVGAASSDIVGNSGNSAYLTIGGGSFASDELHLGVNSSGTGTLTLNSGSASIETLSFRFSTGTGTVNLNGGILTTARINRSYTGTANLNLDNATIRASADEAAFLGGLTNTFVKSGGVTIDSSTRAISIAQPLKNDPASPGGGLTKTGTGSLALSAANTFTGPTAISAGILIPENPAAISDNTSVAADATLALTGGLAFSETQSLTVSGTGQKTVTTLTPAVQRGALQSLSGNNTWHGPVTIATTKTRIGVQDGASLHLTGTIAEVAPDTAFVFRAGANPGDDIIVSNTANTWTGPTIAFSSSANGGALKLGASNALPAASPLLVAGNAVQGRVDLNGHDQAIAGLTNDTGGSSPIGAGVITNTGATPSTLTLVPTTSRIFIGTIQDGTQPVHLVKSGPATQTLSEPQEYTGDTTVNAGTLRIDHPYLSDESAVAIATAAKLDLNFTGSDTVHSLTLGGVPMPSGTYSTATHPASISGTGSLAVAFGPAPGYDAWAATWQIAEGSTGDDDSDGLENLAEYALGLDPKTPDPSPGTWIGNLLTFHKGAEAVAAGDVSYAIETSPNLEPESWTVVTTASNNESIISYSLPTGQDSVFVRLRVVR